MITNWKDFKERLIYLFLEDKQQTRLKGKFTLEQRKEYIETIDDKEFKEMYDFAFVRYGKHDSFTDEELVFFVHSLQNVEGLYFYEKEHPPEPLDESKYPMTFKEWEEAVVKIYLENPNNSMEYLEHLLADDPTLLRCMYEHNCYNYDEAVRGESNLTPDKFFTEYDLAANTVFVLEWL